MNNFMTMYNKFRQNPMSMLSQKYNLPKDLNDPGSIIQYLLNTNQITQSQLNNVNNAVRNNPMFKNLMQ